MGRAWQLLGAVAWRMVLLMLALVALVFGCCEVIRVVNPPPKTYRFVFPAGTRPTHDMTDSGFVLRTMVPGAPPLPREDGFRLVRFDLSKSIDTSEEYVFGNEYFREEHYLVAGDGRREEIGDIGCICIRERSDKGRSVPSLPCSACPEA